MVPYRFLTTPGNLRGEILLVWDLLKTTLMPYPSALFNIFEGDQKFLNMVQNIWMCPNIFGHVQKF